MTRLELSVLAAQCTAGAAECDLPRTLPWYFGLAMALAWLATVAGIVLLVRRRLLTRRAARRDVNSRKSSEHAVSRRNRRDVELW